MEEIINLLASQAPMGGLGCERCDKLIGFGSNIRSGE